MVSRKSREQSAERASLAVVLSVLGLLAGWGDVRAQPVEWIQAVRPFEVIGIDGEVIPYPFAGGFIAPRPHLVDLDGDGDSDLVINEGGEGLAFYERTINGPAFNYAWRTDRLLADGQPIAPGTWSVFGDLDSDGDLDLLTQGEPGRVRYYRNSGTPQDRQFTLAADQLLATNDLPVTNEDTSIPALADIDGDGDLDFLHGQADRGHVTLWRHEGVEDGVPQFTFVTNDWQGIEVFEPNPTCQEPRWETGRGSLHGANAIALPDVDDDGDVDFFWGDFFTPSLYYFRNDGSAASPDFEQVSEEYPLDEPLTSGGYNVPAFGDVDADGDLDLVIGIIGGLCSNVENRFDNLYFYENVGSEYRCCLHLAHRAAYQKHRRGRSRHAGLRRSRQRRRCRPGGGQRPARTAGFAAHALLE